MSKQARNFIERLIEPNLKIRMTVEDAINHPWISTEKDDCGIYPTLRTNNATEVFLRLKDFVVTKRL